MATKTGTGTTEKGVKFEWRIDRALKGEVDLAVRKWKSDVYGGINNYKCKKAEYDRLISQNNLQGDPSSTPGEPRPRPRAQKRPKRKRRQRSSASPEPGPSNKRQSTGYPQQSPGYGGPAPGHTERPRQYGDDLEPTTGFRGMPAPTLPPSQPYGTPGPSTSTSMSFSAEGNAVFAKAMDQAIAWGQRRKGQPQPPNQNTPTDSQSERNDDGSEDAPGP